MKVQETPNRATLRQTIAQGLLLSQRMIDVADYVEAACDAGDRQTLMVGEIVETVVEELLGELSCLVIHE